MLFVLIYCHVYIKLKWEVKKKILKKRQKPNKKRRKGQNTCEIHST